MVAIGHVLIDGEPVAAQDAAISVFDIGFQRGYGCFEALRAYGGVAFRVERHVDRLEASAELLHLPIPDKATVASWISDRAAEGGDCVVRTLVSGGTSLAAPGTGSVVIVYAEPLPDIPEVIRLAPLDAPWHSGGTVYQLTGGKTLSYGPNLAASVTARRAGFDDALLLGRDGAVLEGPTHSVAWIIGDVLETPELSLGILDSITRGAVLEVAPSIGLDVDEGTYPLSRLLGADEVVALSTTKEVTSVVAVGSQTWTPGHRARALKEAFSDLVARETSSS